MIDRVKGLLDVTVTIEAYKSHDAYGKVTRGAKRQVKARIEQGTVATEGGRGQEAAPGRAMPGRFKVILGEPVVIDPRDVVTLPAEFGVRDGNGDFQPAQPAILEVRPKFYRGRHDHTVLILG